jgi:hypothetical protein
MPSKAPVVSNRVVVDNTETAPPVQQVVVLPDGTTAAGTYANIHYMHNQLCQLVPNK